MDFLFGKYQVLVLRYPYLKNFFGIFRSKKDFEKKITRQGSVQLPYADFF